MGKYVIGIDFGTDSVRTLLVDASSGEELKASVKAYLRWKEGRYCEPGKDVYRQHPLDYIESFEESIKVLLESLPLELIQNIEGLTVSTTGSTVAAVDRHGLPLAILPEFAENPNAMFILWKDHSANQEAQEINELCARWPVDYSKFSGGIYSSEWFWAKILHTLRIDSEIAEAAYSWLEHCDWFTALLCGISDITEIKRSRCAAGHKAMWHKEFSGLPSEDFLQELDPLLGGLRNRLFHETFTSDQSAGFISAQWAARLGLPSTLKIGVGLLDAHAGAVGANIGLNSLVKVIGTSTCDMLNVSSDLFSNKIVRGICGQVEGSIIPNYLGLEAGQSAFGDAFSWFKELIFSPVKALLSQKLSEEELQKFEGEILVYLSEEAQKIPVQEMDMVAVDWINGRRTPDVNMTLSGGLIGLSLGTNVASIFKSLVEATAFGSKAIIDRFESEGVEIKEVIALGGITKKSEYVMQTLANVLNLKISVVKSEQACALGSAMLSATACGIYSTVQEAQQAMTSGFSQTFSPEPAKVEIYQGLYSKYKAFGQFIEKAS